MVSIRTIGAFPLDCAASAPKRAMDNVIPSAAIMMICFRRRDRLSRDSPDLATSREARESRRQEIARTIATRPVDKNDGGVRSVVATLQLIMVGPGLSWFPGANDDTSISIMN